MDDIIKEVLPEIRQAFDHLFKFWNCLNRAEDILGIDDIKSSTLIKSNYAICTIEELTDDVLIEFIKGHILPEPETAR